MSGKPRKGGRGRKGPSAEQRHGNAVFAEVMKAWNELRDQERLAWHVEGGNRRTKGINYFKQVNLRRLRRGEELARVPPRSKPYDGRPLLKRLVIRNRGGRISLALELRQMPTAPTTVWGARPCNPGVAKPDKCPRLDWLPVPQGRMSVITGPYFQKHSAYIWEHGIPLVGQRIFIRVRQEVDEGANLYEQVSAVVPAPEGGPRSGQAGPNPVVTPS